MKYVDENVGDIFPEAHSGSGIALRKSSRNHHGESTFQIYFTLHIPKKICSLLLRDINCGLMVGCRLMFRYVSFVSISLYGHVYPNQNVALTFLI